MEGRGRAFMKKIEQSEPGKPAQLISMVGRGRAFFLKAMDSRPGSMSSGYGSNPTETNGTASTSPATLSTPSPLANTSISPSQESDQSIEEHESVVSQPVFGGRGRGGLLEMLGLPAVSRNIPIKSLQKETPEPSTVESVTSLMARSTIDHSGKSESVKSDRAVHMTGVSGTQIPVQMNYIRMNFKQNFGVFEYEIKFDPVQDTKTFSIAMLRSHADILGKYTFDGNIMYRPTKLPEDITLLKSTHPGTGELVSIKIIYKKIKKLSEMTHLFNILFKRIMVQLKMVEFKRQYYDPKKCQCIPQYKLEIWPGYVTAVDEYEGGLMLCINPSHRVLRQQRVLEVIRDVAQHTPHNWQSQLKLTLLNQVIMTTYNNKSYRIDDIDFSMTPMSSFTTKNGEMTFVEYYKQNYGINIKDMQQPLLISRKEHRTSMTKEPEIILLCLIPELCNMTGITDEMRTNMDLMKEMARYTRITPNQRIAAIQTFIDNVNHNPQAKQILDDWGLVLDPNCLKMQARVLQPETIIFGDDRRVAGNENADWGRDVTNNKCITAMNIKNWVLIFVKKDFKYSKIFTETLRNCGPPMGMRIELPHTICLESDRPEAYVQALKKVICGNGNLDVVVCISPTMRDDRYSAIKTTCCVTNPIPSQVINSRTLANPKKLKSIVQKVALQINCKMGGTLWSVNMPLKNVMVVGIDVYHGGAKSCAAFVASSNASMTRWLNKAMFQQAGQEIIDGLKTAFMEAIHNYFRVNSQFPSRIIIYRDGVGDGQLETTRCYEVQQLESCFPLVRDDYKPQLTFVVVHKRINTRIFLELNCRELVNPNPGTIVDHTVTRKSYYDFFLVSQKVRQGTVTPTHYVVVHDTSGMAPDHLQRLTYKLCHLYYNWPGTVRVPAPCQYAHKLASLIGQSVGKPHNDCLSDRLFYL